MKKSCSAFLLILIVHSLVAAQGIQSVSYDSLAKLIITKALVDNKAYETLYELTTKVGNRVSGSAQAAKAVEWSKSTMMRLGFDNVHLEPVMVPHWVRGSVEQATVLANGSRKAIPLNIVALGGTIGTPKQGITAEVVEVKSFEELKALGDKAKEKIVFFNRPMDRSLVSTFQAYGGAVNQRVRGAVEAARVGGVFALVRSMTTRLDDVPHTGAMNYADSIPKVPTGAVSTKGAELLSEIISKEKNVKITVNLSAQILPDVESANVVGELRGSEKPDEVIVLGGHLDSWDKGQGAHDDGSGCVQSIEALRLLKELGLKPKRTIRTVNFINEENGLRGGTAYASKDRGNEKPLAAIESDAGGFSPRGFGISDSTTYTKLAKWAPLLASIGADRFVNGGGGADIGPLARKGAAVIGLNVDNQRYFDYHHSDSDTIDKVNERELALGAAAMAILAYVIAQEGF
jgi:Zn-dependent M28 family amino/carboxypeptidase